MEATNQLKFGSGPWDSEPDREQWKDEKTNLDCLIIRHHSLGHLAGYVGVPVGHPLHGKHYNSDDVGGVSVHGGLTWSDDGEGDEHRPAGFWWFGFDCAHLYDLVPGYPERMRDGTYRDWKFVKGEVVSLASQIAAIADSTEKAHPDAL